jgi:PAS domain S-box-containing protein
VAWVEIMKLPLGVHSLLFFPQAEIEQTASFDAEAILDSLLTQSTDCIAIKDRQGRYIWINPAGAAFLGKSIEDVIGRTDWELFDTQTARFVVSSDQAVMVSGKTQTVEKFLKPLNGQDRYFQAMKCPYRTPDGRVQGIINVVRDITDKQHFTLKGEA